MVRISSNGPSVCSQAIPKSVTQPAKEDKPFMTVRKPKEAKPALAAGAFMKVRKPDAEPASPADRAFMTRRKPEGAFLERRVIK